jgi:hypothetical protein
VSVPRLATLLAVVACLALPARAEARVCDYLPIACSYEGAAFSFTVVDAETGRPLADVHALAEWQQYGFHGSGGPMMVQDATSGPDGVLRFPAWGPLRGSREGLNTPKAPVVTLFKAGHKPLVIYNTDGRTPAAETVTVQRFVHDGGTFPMEPFRGTEDEWAREIGTVAFPHVPTGDETLRRFRAPYSNRARLVWKERDKLPPRFRDRGQVFWHLEGLLLRLEKGQP